VNLLQLSEEGLKSGEDFISKDCPQTFLLSGCDVVAIGPLMKQPCSMPFRTVILSRGSTGFVVNDEYFSSDGTTDLGCGNYFDTFADYTLVDSFSDALAEFAKRISSQSEYAKSLKRHELKVVDA